MKILYLINQVLVSNGAANVVFNIISNQVHECSQIDVLTLVDKKPSLENRIKSLGCGFKIIGYRYNPFILFRLIKEFSKYDVVHVHLFPSFYWAAIASFFIRKNIKLVVTEHSTWNNRRKYHIFKYIEKIIYRRYDKIIAISTAIKRQLVANGVSIEKVKVIYNGIDIQNMENAIPLTRDEIDLPLNAFVITQVARFSSEKDQETLIRSMKYFPESFYVVFVGGGKLMQKHVEMAKSLGVIDRIRFLGTRNDVASILKISNVIVQSSHFEGFGLAAVEGMSVGKPVVASDVEGMNEVVKGAGLLFKPHNDYELASLILKLYEDVDYYNTVAQLCKERSSIFDVKNMASQYMAIYNEITSHTK